MMLDGFSRFALWLKLQHIAFAQDGADFFNDDAGLCGGFGLFHACLVDFTIAVKNDKIQHENPPVQDATIRSSTRYGR